MSEGPWNLMEKKEDKTYYQRAHGKKRLETAFAFRHRYFLFIITYVGAFSLSMRGATIDEDLYSLFNPGRLELMLFSLAFSIVGIVGFFFRLWAAGYIGSETVHSQNIVTSKVITQGPYAHTGNPLYFGLLLIALGFLPELSLIGFIFLLVSNALLVAVLIGIEQKAHIDVGGPEYLAYQNSVPLLFPSLKRRTPSAQTPFNLKEGFRTEAMNIFVFSTLVASLTLNGTYFLLTVIFLFLAGGLLKLYLDHRET
jgi:protein-S-isoprenylcysteine O-methyltransferase Ste14